MLFQAGRLTGACLRPALRLHGDVRHICPVVPRLAVSATSVLPVSPCLSPSSCRHGSSKAMEHDTRQEVVNDKGRSQKKRALAREGDRHTQGQRAKPSSGNKQPISVDQIGTLVKAGEATNPKDISLDFEKLVAPVTVAKLWLRDACQCHLCVSESSGQKRFATCDIPSDLEVDSLRVLEDGGLEVSWTNDLALGGDQHVSTYPLSWLHGMLLRAPPYRLERPAQEIWDSQHFEKDSQSREISYESWMEDGSHFAEAFRNLQHWGLVVIRGVPQTESAVEQVASRIGHLQATFYGPTWDVVSKPQAENVAYTNEFLCLHQDLMYLNEPPRIQVLHCLENGCEGGDSLFSDGLRAAYDLRYNNPTHYLTLATCPVDFHYAKGGHYWNNQHETILVKPKRRHASNPSPLSVRWSPPFQAPFWKAIEHATGRKPFDDRAGSLIERWQEAAKVFRNSIEDPANMVQFRLQPGDCVVFDNWRVLHGRRAFDTASGRRHLRGTYVEDQALNSTWVRLQREGLVVLDKHYGVVEENNRARRLLSIKDNAAGAELSDGDAKA